MRLGIALALILILFIIHSCRKEIRTGTLQTTLSKADIGELQGIYSKGIVSGSGITVAAVGSSNFPNLVHGLNVKWDKYVVNNRIDNSQVVEFDMQPDSTFYLTRRTKAGDSVYYANRTSAVFIKLNDGRRLNFFMKVIEDFTSTHKSVMSSMHYTQVPATFSGIVIYYTLDRKFINGYRFKNGKKISKMGMPAANSSQQIASLTKRVNVAEPDPDPDQCGGTTIIWGIYNCEWDPDEQVFYCDGVPLWDFPDPPCDPGSGTNTGNTGVTGDPAGSGTSPTPPVDTANKKIIRGYCDGVTDDQKQQIQDALAAFKNEGCVQAKIYSYLYNSLTIQFCVSDALDNNGNPTAGGANPADNSITFQSGLISSDMDEEFFHIYQNAVYTGGTVQYLNNGKADIEFEAKFFNDIMNPPADRPGALYRNPDNVKLFYSGDIDAYNQDVADYDAWLIALTQNGTYYPKSMADVDQTQYTKFLNIFSKLNPQNGPPVNLAPQAIFKSLSLYSCK